MHTDFMRSSSNLLRKTATEKDLDKKIMCIDFTTLISVKMSAKKSKNKTLELWESKEILTIIYVTIQNWPILNKKE